MDKNGSQEGRWDGTGLLTPARTDLIVDGLRLNEAVGEGTGSDQRAPRSFPKGAAAARVFLGIRDLSFHQEVLDYLGRDERIETVAATTDPHRFRALAVGMVTDVVLACPEMGRELLHPSARPERSDVLVVTPEMTIQVLRDAIDLGAAGVFAWPDERVELADVVARVARHRGHEPATRGQIIAVCGARGGVGTTFVASHLSAGLAAQGVSPVVVDLDTGFADMTLALGIGPQDQPRTMADLVPVRDELSPDHIEDALYRHPRGFAALLAPADPAPGPSWSGLYSACIALLAGAYPTVVLHLARSLDEAARRAIELADDVVLVTALDLFSLYGARRIMSGFALEDRPDRWRVVVNFANHAGPSELSERDVERILGVPVFATIRFDPAVRRALSRAELLPARARRAGGDLRRLAGLLVPEAAQRREAKEA